MSELGMWLAALFTGVFGAAIGFIVIGLVAFILVMPYILMNRKSQAPPEEGDSLNPRY